MVVVVESWDDRMRLSWEAVALMRGASRDSDWVLFTPLIMQCREEQGFRSWEVSLHVVISGSDVRRWRRAVLIYHNDELGSGPFLWNVQVQGRTVCPTQTSLEPNLLRKVWGSQTNSDLQGRCRTSLPLLDIPLPTNFQIPTGRATDLKLNSAMKWKWGLEMRNYKLNYKLTA